jgi:hypothetical protein
MVRFVDVPLDGGDPNRAVADITAAIAESSNSRAQQTTTQDTRSVTRNDDVDSRFSGKSTADIVNMYKNLESHSGRLANQLGETKQALNQIILEKRGNDIRQNGGTVTESVKIQPTDLMVNPTEAIDRLLDNRMAQRPEISALQQRLNQLEAQLGQNQLMNRHPNAQQESVDPAFQAWAQQTPLRQKLLSDAANNPYAAEALLTEWEAAKPQSAVTVTTNRAQELARKVSLESSNTGSESGNSPSTKGTRLLQRRDIIKLRQTNPDLYESPAYQAEIMKAYAENRVVGDP